MRNQPIVATQMVKEGDSLPNTESIDITAPGRPNYQ